MNDININKIFETQDLNLTAVLLVRGFILKTVVKNPDGKSKFCFSFDVEIEKTIQQYWDNKLLINPQELFHYLKVLKNRIYSNY
jgi:hypothetical protein